MQIIIILLKFRKWVLYLDFYDSMTDKCNNMWRCFAALCSMFPTDVDDLILSLCKNISSKLNCNMSPHFVLECRRDSRWYSYLCFLCLSYIFHQKTLEFDVRIHKIKWTSFVLKWFFRTYIYIPCLSQACACFVSHLAVNIIQRVETALRSVDFTTKSLLLFMANKNNQFDIIVHVKF